MLSAFPVVSEFMGDPRRQQPFATLEFTHFLTAETHLTPMNKGEGAFS